MRATFKSYVKIRELQDKILYFTIHREPEFVMQVKFKEILWLDIN